MRKGESVTNALYESGFNSSSRLYEHAAEELGMTPATYSRGGRGVNINYTIVASSMGRLLVAVTERGVCAVRMADTDAELEKGPARRVSARADQTRDDSALREPVQKILNHLDNNEPQLDLATRYQSDSFSTSGLGEAALDSLRANSFVRRRCQSFGKAGRGAGSRPRVRDKSGRTRDSVSSRGA